MDTDTVKVVNNCTSAVRVYLRFVRPKRGGDRRPTSFDIEPGQESRPIPRRLLAGARDWSRLQSNSCIQIESVAFDPRYIRLLNESSKPISLTLRPRKAKAPKTLVIRPDKKSRVLDVSAVPKPRLRELQRKGQLSVIPVYEIGPAGTSQSRGWSDGEDVYTCYECGGPIVFRGSPPTPVHI